MNLCDAVERYPQLKRLLEGAAASSSDSEACYYLGYKDACLGNAYNPHYWNNEEMYTMGYEDGKGDLGMGREI